MGSLAELTLGCRAPGMVGNLFKAAPSSTEQFERVHVLERYLKALEDERRKIEAFKRELPHCMQLLDYAIEASKGHLVDSAPSWSSRQQPFFPTVGNNGFNLGLFGKETVEGFLKTRWEPAARKEDRDEEKEVVRRSSSSTEGDRPTWMAEAQLWSQPSIRSDQWKEKESSTEDTVRRQKDSAEQSTVTSPAFLFSSKQRPGGAFTPFVKEKPAPNLAVRAKAVAPEITLTSGESRPSTQGFGAVESEVINVEVSTRTREVNTDVSPGKDTVGGVTNGGKYSSSTGSTTSGGSNAQRKARRCWSPELHRRFVSALQQLGGSQLATPKQIRELMKVDGLTNDEVKSHLQKYRLHTRRPSPTPVPQQGAPQLVVLGGIWVHPEYGAAGMYPSTPASQQEPHFCQPSISQSEFYSQLHPSSQIELHRSPSHGSPQGPLQSTSNPSSGARQTSGEAYREDSAEEDGKSESSSWKGENNSRGSSENEDASRKRAKSSRDDEDDDEDDDDVDDADNERDSATRLELKMSCSSEHSVKAEPNQE